MTAQESGWSSALNAGAALVTTFVLVDGVEIWRGETANDSLTEAVQIAAANHILAILGEPGQDGTEPPA